MSKIQKQSFKCPLGDPKVFCEPFIAMHKVVTQIKAESLDRDMSVKEVESHLVFIRDRVDEILEKVRSIPIRR
jgi:hypothetical protein